MTNNIISSLSLKINTDLDTFKTLMNEMVASTKGEQGTLNYEWFISEDGKSCHVFERYADSDALMSHLGNFSTFAERFMAAVEVTSLQVYGNPNEQVVEALTGFGADFLKPLGGFARETALSH